MAAIQIDLRVIANFEFQSQTRVDFNFVLGYTRQIAIFLPVKLYSTASISRLQKRNVKSYFLSYLWISNNNDNDNWHFCRRWFL